jgi:N-acetyl-gamma-glutamyl-phosphate/LysW-gamma-L-alpha-aminoadipyl-6-phosphate reductase
MAIRAAIIGGTGYGGAEILRHLLRHPQVSVARITAADNIGKPVGEVHLNLLGQTDLVFEELPAKEAVRGCDIAFMALPHRVSAKVAMELFETGVRIVDLSGDFRLRDPAAYRRDYHVEHPCPEALGTFVYGLPEVNREPIRAATRIASPGCFATTIALGLLPLAKAGLLTGPVRTVGITGSSGSGAAPSLGVHHAIRANNLRTYRPLAHQHRPEMLGDAGARDLALEFVPISAPLPRGILATSFAEVPADLGEERALELWQRCFAGEPFVKLVRGRHPEVVGVCGTNYVEVGFELGPVRGDRRTMVCFSALDNLVKGGAGQAIQSMNLMLGLPETLTLDDPGLWP